MKSIDNEMEVGMGQFRKADARTNQFTTHLKPCLGVAFYNKNTKESHMLHYPTLDFYDFDANIETVKNDLGIKDTSVYVCGGSTSSTHGTLYNNAVIKDRDYIESVLKKNFNEDKICFNWSDIDEIAELYLNKNLDEFILKKEKVI